MINLIIGIVIGYILAGLVVLLCNTFNVDEDIKDSIIAFVFIPLVIVNRKIRKK